MLVRAAIYGLMEQWNVDSIDDLQINSLNLWAPSTIDNDYSVFEVDKNEKSEMMNNVVIRMLASRFDRYKDGIQFFLINENDIERFEMNVKKDAEKLHCVHANIKDLKYKGFKQIVNYSFENKNNYISYDACEIRDIIKGLNQDRINEFIEYWATEKNNSTDNIVKIINNRYFKMSGEKIVYSK